MLLLFNVKTFAPQEKMNKAVTMLQNCPMFSVRLWLTTSYYRWPIGSLPSTCMPCIPHTHCTKDVYTPQGSTRHLWTTSTIRGMLTERCDPVVNTPVSYSGGSGFETRPRRPATLVEFFMVFLRFSRQIPGYCLKTRPQPLRTKSFQFTAIRFFTLSLTLYI
jgi:hypothetical protein